MEHLSAAQRESLQAQILEAAFEQPRFLRVPRNERGRDFVIGDVHGAFDLVWKGMLASGFDRTRDRLFSVGDLVDRGEGSARAAAFLDQPYLMAVAGNHERELVDLYANEASPCETLEALARVNFNGMGWLADTSAEQRMGLITRFARLPLALEVQTARGTVGILYGEVPIGMTWPQFTAALQAGDAQVIASCLWGRERINQRAESGVLGVGRLFAGHTPQFEGARRLGNVYAIDTGAIFAEVMAHEGAAMTFANLACRTDILATPRQEGDVRLFPEVSEAPFGQYARVRP